MVKTTPVRTTPVRTVQAQPGRMVEIRHRLDDPATCTVVGDAGYITAEYAVGMIAAVAFAGILLAVVKSGAVKSMLTAIIERALGG